MYEKAMLYAMAYHERYKRWSTLGQNLNALSYRMGKKMNTAKTLEAWLILRDLSNFFTDESNKAYRQEERK